MSKFRFTSRTKARKRAADVVFEADQRGMGRDPEVLRDILRQRRVVTAAQTPLPEYSVRIVEGVADHLRRIDDYISARAKVAGLDRVAAVDLAVMRVAVWEMLENSADVPAVIAIDEAISIVKSLSTDASPAFVNAVLDAIRKDIEAPSWSRRSAEGKEDGSSPVESGKPVDVGQSAEDEEPSAEALQALQDDEVLADWAEDMSAEDLEELDELLGEY